MIFGVNEEKENLGIFLSRKELIENNIDVQKYDGYLVLGTLVVQVLIEHLGFMYICQTRKSLSRIRRSISLNRLMFKMIRSHFKELSFLDSEEYGIVEKTKIGYRWIGLQYKTKGYEYLAALFKEICLLELKFAASMPINDYEHVVKSFFWNNYHKKPSYNVQLVKSFDEVDQVYSASICNNGELLSALGVTKKDAITATAKKFANRFIPSEVALSGTSPVEVHEFFFDANVSITEYDLQIEKLHQSLGIDYAFLWFSLLSRNQTGNLRNLMPTDVNASKMKHGLIDFGEAVMVLFLFEYNFNHNKLNNIDLSLFDMSYPKNMGSEKVYSSLCELLKVREFSNQIYNYFELGNNKEVNSHNTNNYQVPFSLLASFFISNFSANVRFSEIFNSVLSEFYSLKYAESITNYLLAFQNLSNRLGLKVCYDNKILDDGRYQQEIYFDGFRGIYSCCVIAENSKIAKSTIWQKAFQEIFEPIQTIFRGDASQKIDFKVFNFVIERIINLSLPFTFQLKKYLLALDVNYARTIGCDCYFYTLQVIFANIKGRREKLAFAEKLSYLNNGKYFIIDEKTVDASEVVSTIVRNSPDSSLNFLKTVMITEKLEVEGQLTTDAIFTAIVNPSMENVKSYVRRDYKNIKKLNHVTFEIAKIALDLSTDAYSYIQNPSKEIIDYFSERIRLEDELLSNKIGQLDISADGDTKICILDSHTPVNEQLIKLCQGRNLRQIIIACGYTFSSGILMIKDLLNKSTENPDISVQFLIGALQKYNSCVNNQRGQLTGIDKKTGQFLKLFLQDERFSLFTCEKRFYHGKIFFLKGDQRTLICMGSSNVSRSAFVSNYELNIAFDVLNTSSIYFNFNKWIDQLLYNSTRLKELDLEIFSDNEMKVEGASVITRVSFTAIQHRINELSNEEVKYRLNLWMENRPDVIVEDLCVVSLPAYIAFVYKEQNLLVIESFQAGNAYFCINYRDSFEEEINRISGLSKVEIFQYSRMPKRGYHTPNKFTLESNIRRFFRNKDLA